jgi:hypothetical protein
MGRKKVNQDRVKIDVDTLCDLVNSKYNLRPNQIGSIEWHSDTCENAIVQIMNQYRGIRQLITGPEPVLRQYLQNILEDKTQLNLNLYRI